jgi:signal transduction histidine kinase
LLIGAMETERARLARELHDDLSQRIALLSIKLHMLDTSTEAAIAEQVHSLSANIEEISNEVRRLSHQLHPSTLEQLGLESALRGFCRELNEAHKIKITLDCDSLPQTLSKNISLCMFRITQEALRNVVKHSGRRCSDRNGADKGRYSQPDGCGWTAKVSIRSRMPPVLHSV